jgi:hypothetical protein
MAVRVHVHDDRLQFDLDGIDALVALSWHFAIPMDHVVSASVRPFAEVRPDLGWRLGGTWIPGIVSAGTYGVTGRPGARQFLSVYRDPEVLVIDTDLERPARVVVQHPDRHDLAWFIGERVGDRAQG